MYHQQNSVLWCHLRVITKMLHVLFREGMPNSILGDNAIKLGSFAP